MKTKLKKCERNRNRLRRWSAKQCKSDPSKKLKGRNRDRTNEVRGRRKATVIIRGKGKYWHERNANTDATAFSNGIRDKGDWNKKQIERKI
jgi:hypothetical protein